MDLITGILIAVLVIIGLTILFKIVWFFLPFILIAFGILYLYQRFFVKPNGERTQTRSQQSPYRKPNDDVVDVEFTVRDDEDENY